MSVDCFVILQNLQNFSEVKMSYFKEQKQKLIIWMSVSFPNSYT